MGLFDKLKDLAKNKALEALEGLKDKKAWEEAGVVLPEYDIAKIADNTKKSPKWLHFGVGNIFRIFKICVMICHMILME